MNPNASEDLRSPSYICTCTIAWTFLSRIGKTCENDVAFMLVSLKVAKPPHETYEFQYLQGEIRCGCGRLHKMSLDKVFMTGKGRDTGLKTQAYQCTRGSSAVLGPLPTRPPTLNRALTSKCQVNSKKTSTRCSTQKVAPMNRKSFSLTACTFFYSMANCSLAVSQCPTPVMFLLASS